MKYSIFRKFDFENCRISASILKVVTYLVINFDRSLRRPGYRSADTSVQSEHSRAPPSATSLVSHRRPIRTDGNTTSMSSGLAIADEIVKLYGIPQHLLLFFFYFKL